MKKKIFIILGVVAGLAAIGLVVVPYFQARQAMNQTQGSFQTEPAALGNINVSVGGTGGVRSNQSAVLAWETSGQVTSVLANKDQQVDAETILAELDPSSLPQNVLMAQVDLVNAQNDLENAINNNEARANAHLALIQAEKAVDDAEEETQSKLYQRASQETIDIARANLINANEGLDQAESVWEQTQGAGEDSPVYAAGLSQYAAARQVQQKAEYNLRYVEGLPDPLTVEETNVKLDQAQAQLLTAKQNWEKVKDGPDADQVLAAQTRIDIAQAALDTARLSAPFTGTIVNVETITGDLVSPGTLAFQIDDLSRLLVDVDISEVDINRVQVGQPVNMTFDAIPAQEFSGIVNDIASFGSNTTGTVNFTVTVEIQSPSAEIKPGMTAAVNIIVSQLDDVLLVPSRAVRTVNGKRVVYVLENNVPVPVEIKLGESANNYSQIVDGDVQEGDLIVINPPTEITFPMGPGGGGMGGDQQPAGDQP